MSDCPHCRTFAVENEKLTDEVSGLLSLTRRQALSEQALRRELKNARHAEPLARDITAILKLWRALCSTKRSSIDLDGKRAAIARTALKSLTAADPDATPEEQRRQRRRMCMDAVRGLALRPYVVNAQRKGAGTKDQRYAKIEHALGDEGRIEDHAGFYRMAQAKPSEWHEQAYCAAADVSTRWFDLWQSASYEAKLEQSRERLRNDPAAVKALAASSGFTVEQVEASIHGRPVPPADRPHLFLIEGEAA